MSKKKRLKLSTYQKLSGPAGARYGTLPQVRLPGANELQCGFNDSLAQILRSSGLYRRDILPVIPFENRLLEMKPANFITWVTDYLIPIKVKHDQAGNPTNIIHDMTESHAKNCLADTSFIQSLASITRVHPTPVPIINDVGSMVLCTPGFDPSTGTFIFGEDLTQLPPDPARAPLPGLIDSSGYYDDSLTLGEAFWRLYDFHRAFPFSDWAEEPVTPPVGHPLHAYDPVTGDHRSYFPCRSLAVHIGAMLAVFAGGCVPKKACRMAILYDANQRRSGKTLLAKIAVACVHGMFKAQPWRGDDEALIKIIDSEVLAASPYICFDNVRGMIESPALESLLTSPTWTGRILGRSEMFTAENHIMTLITGNNITPGPDIAERSLWCTLFCEESDPQDRTIDAAIIDDVWLSSVDNRRSILSALWSIVRHWDHAGRPAATGKLRRGYEAWCSIIGGMVEFTGFGDILGKPILESAGDTEAEDIAQLVRFLHSQGQPDYTYLEIVHHCSQEGFFPWNLHGKEETFPLRDGSPCVLSLRLDTKCASRMGLLLSRHAPERGSVHSLRIQAAQKPIRLRFWAKNKGRHKRFYVTPA